MIATLRVKKLRPDASLPRYATAGAAGLDLVAAIDSSIELAPGAVVRISTGIAIELPPGHEGQVRPRSGLAAKYGITVLNAPGTIDEDYRGEVQVILVNQGRAPHRIQSGDRIAQLVIAPVARVEVEEITALAGTKRGEGGFGSTGSR